MGHEKANLGKTQGFFLGALSQQTLKNKVLRVPRVLQSLYKSRNLLHRHLLFQLILQGIQSSHKVEEDLSVEFSFKEAIECDLYCSDFDFPAENISVHILLVVQSIASHFCLATEKPFRHHASIFI